MDGSVYFIAGAQQDELALSSFLIPNGTTKKVDRSCCSCVYESTEEPHDFLVQGFDDFDGFDGRVKAFLPQTPPLVTAWDSVIELSRLITGAVPVKVGFNEWDQLSVPKERWFTIGPRLGALFVTAVSRRLFDHEGNALPVCPICGQQKIRWSKVSKRISEYRIQRDSWPGTHLFLIEGGGQHRGVCVTDDGLRLIHGQGFLNLEVVEMAWG